MKHLKDYLIHPQTQSTSFIIIQPMTITTEQIEGLKQRYAQMIVDGLDMNDLITLAVDSIVENLKGYEIDDINLLSKVNSASNIFPPQDCT